MNVVLIGAGQRGRIYSSLIHEQKLGTIVAVVEPHEERRERARKLYAISEQNCFTCEEELWAQGCMGDVAIIASLDQHHFRQAMKALELGYNLLMEKPISPSPKECILIAQKANSRNKQVAVCHVLRYTPFFSAIKNILDSGELGKIVSIQHNENIGSYHMAHSFVRGNWRSSTETCPIITAKSCHDMDILTWLANSPAKQVTSFGNLRYFKKENAPEGSALRCINCVPEVAQHCTYNAFNAYLPVKGMWPATVVSEQQDEKSITQALTEGPYGRCVFHCDNDVCDIQTSMIEFENGITASFILSSFTDVMCRTLKIMCEKGEILGHDGNNLIEVRRFRTNRIQQTEYRTIHPAAALSGHGGGDNGIIDDFFSSILLKGQQSRTSIDQSIESHLIAHAAETSRLNGEIINMAKLRASLGCT